MHEYPPQVTPEDSGGSYLVVVRQLEGQDGSDGYDGLCGDNLENSVGVTRALVVRQVWIGCCWKLEAFTVPWFTDLCVFCFPACFVFRFLCSWLCLR